MEQTIHILLKDIRYLRREICLLLAIMAIFVWMRAQPPQRVSDAGLVTIALFIVVTYVVARLVHAEAIPGDRQFWLTRPYRWDSLLFAKLLFIACFVNVPILVAQAIILGASGYTLVPLIPGLLWAQVMLAACLLLPVAGLAALTRGLVPFVFSLLAVLLAYIVFVQWAQLRPVAWYRAADWIRYSLIVAGLLAISVVVLYQQYRNRRTLVSRVAALSGFASAVAVFAFLPSTAVLGTQTRIGAHRVAAPLLRIEAEQADLMRGPFRQRVLLPIRVSGFPANQRLQLDGVALTMTHAGGRSRSFRPEEISVTSATTREGARFGLGLDFLDDFVPAGATNLVRVRGSLYATVFGNSKSRTIPLLDTPVDALDGLKCYEAIASDLICRAALRWPSRHVEADVGSSGIPVPFPSFAPYSPFPAELTFDPIVTQWLGAPRWRSAPARNATITTMEPLTHFRQDFELPELELRNYSLTLPSQ